MKPGLLPIRFGKALSFELNRRILADYEEGGVTQDGAAEAIASATAFVAAVNTLIAKQQVADKRDPGSNPG